nr:reverse transcriptase domain-containing protein [Tanacetum cinerariifolium]
MVQSWQRTVKQKVTQSFERVGEIAFLQLAASNRTEGPLVIEAKMGGHMIHRMYIDGGSSMEILYEHCFNRLRPEIKSQMVPTTTSLTGFSGETIWPLGQLRLLVTIRDATHYTKAWMNFMVVKSMSPYNGGIATIRSTILIPTECASVTKSSVIPKEERTHLASFTVALHPNFPDQEVVIGGSLSDKGRTELCSVLKKNLDIFAWQPSDMTGVPRSVAEHRLNIREGYSPVRQKKKGQALNAPGLYKRSWRMCVDFIDLNKSCPQDCYPLPKIDWKVESLCGYPFKCFLDAYKGYHQIQLAEADEEKTTFHTGHEVYCYTKIPFGLKNAGVTYQQLIDKAFESQFGWNIEVYVDDLMVKSYIEAEMMRDIKETFRILRKVNMKLNPKKCSFGLAEGVFLGYVITLEGIKPCLDKTSVVLQLPSPRTIKEVQSLNGKLASLNRFLSRSAEKSVPLFQTIKKCIIKSDFRWTAEVKQAFQQLKQHLSELPLLVAPKPHEELIMYLSATYGSVSAVLMTERGTTQTAIYFINRALQGPELNYSPMEKLVLSLVFAAKRLRRPRTSVKGQILADFLIEIPGDVSQAAPAVVTQEESWTLFTDGSSCVDGSGAGLILTNPEGIEFTYALRFQFTASNNEAEYEALVAGLRIAAQMGVENVLVEVLENKSIKEKEVAAVIEEDGPTWMIQLVDYLKEGVLPGDKKEARKLRLKARQYELMEGGIDIADPFSEGPGKVKFLIVAMDYFTKWIEAKAVATITGGQMKKFEWDNIRFTSVKLPQSNGLVKRANRSLGERIKACLGEENKNWVEELPHVLWAHRTMIKSSHSDMPFSLTYGTEAVIPTEIGMPTYRTAAIDVVNNDEELRLNLDLLEERRERTAVCKARAKSKMMKYYNARVRDVAFKPGDFVYRSNDASHAIAGGKLGPKWEGPYEVTEALGKGAYKLRSTDGIVLPRT